VGDGAEWIALQTRAVFGADATLLTDFYHVSEYLAAAAPVCRPAAPGPWRHTQQKRLKRGASAQVIQELAVHREAAEVADENAPVRAAHRYLATGPAPSITPQPSPPDCPSAAASSSRDTSTCSKRGSNFPAAPWFLGKRMSPFSSPLNRLPAR
jgi:hypothetical protein